MTNNKQQTAVDWLYETLWKQTDFSLPSNILEQAKEIEKEQIEEAYWEGGQEMPMTGRQCTQYYNETYGGGEQ
jgi:hypothetical protein